MAPAPPRLHESQDRRAPVDGAASGFSLPQLVAVRTTTSGNRRGTSTGTLACGGQSVGLGAMGTNSTGNRHFIAKESVAEMGVVASLVDFKSHGELLRGSRLTQIMRQGAAIYKDSGGSEKTYELSEKVEVLDYFVSHNWIVSRIQKFIGLAVFFNYRIASVVTVVYSVALGLILSLDWLPALKGKDGEVGGVWSSTTSIPVFLFTLLFCRDIMWMCGHRGPAIFLDKTCIHQTDVLQKAAGIRKLGAFLSHSSQMVVLYSDVYLHKLWTCYEVAAFLSLKPAERMIVLPVYKSMLFVCVIVVCYIYRVAGMALWASAGVQWSFQILVPIMAYVYAAAVRKWARQKLKMLTDVSTFSVDACSCFCEEDRPVVYKNIGLLMRASEAVGPDAPLEDSLAAFEELVRSEVYGRVVVCTGHWTFTYEQSCCIGFTFAGTILVDFAYYPHHGWTVREVCPHAINAVAWMFGGWPLACIAMESIARRKLAWRGRWSALWLLFAVVCVISGFLAVNVSLEVLRAFATTSDVALGAMAVVATVLIGLALRFCREQAPKPAALAQAADVDATLPEVEAEVSHRLDETLPELEAEDVVISTVIIHERV